MQRGAERTSLGPASCIRPSIYGFLGAGTAVLAGALAAGCWACAADARLRAVTAAAIRANARPRGPAGATKLQDFIRKTLSETVAHPTATRGLTSGRSTGCLFAK